jgi:predicted Zn-dependent protease
MPEPVAEGEGLLEEIKTKKKITPETTKQKEQIDIIDQFIKKQPSITKNQGSAADASDLAEKNFSLTENIVSETLVEILLRQGKKDKAIEVLKKLIWKFPQKKTIFAAQIEELKK